MKDLPEVAEIVFCLVCFIFCYFSSLEWSTKIKISTWERSSSIQEHFQLFVTVARGKQQRSECKKRESVVTRIIQMVQQTAPGSELLTRIALLEDLWRKNHSIHSAREWANYMKDLRHLRAARIFSSYVGESYYIRSPYNRFGVWVPPVSWNGPPYSAGNSYVGLKRNDAYA